MSAREAILNRTRAALKMRCGEAPTPRLSKHRLSLADKVILFIANFEKLSGKAFLAGSREQARLYVESVIAGRSWMASSSPFLQGCGLVAEGSPATVEVGVTSADYVLADPGTLVMITEPRLVSLLPPIHIAVVQRERLLTNLDELLDLRPLPVEDTSSMVLITGPSRTGDIEQILVKGVHGPGEIHAVIV